MVGPYCVGIGIEEYAEVDIVDVIGEGTGFEDLNTKTVSYFDTYLPISF